MNVQEVIDRLEDVEDQDAEVMFNYGGVLKSVERVEYEKRAPGMVVIVEG